MSSVTGQNEYIEFPSSAAALPTTVRRSDYPERKDVNFDWREEKTWIWVSELDEKDTEEFLKLAGTWEDERSAEEIIKDIYGSRKSSQREDYGL